MIIRSAFKVVLYIYIFLSAYLIAFSIPDYDLWMMWQPSKLPSHTVTCRPGLIGCGDRCGTCVALVRGYYIYLYIYIYIYIYILAAPPLKVSLSLAHTHTHTHPRAHTLLQLYSYLAILHSKSVYQFGKTAWRMHGRPGVLSCLPTIESSLVSLSLVSLSRVSLSLSSLSLSSLSLSSLVFLSLSLSLSLSLFSLSGQKFYHVMLPHTNKQLLRDWDLWGPLAITMSLAIMLRHSAQEGQQTQVFTGVFVRG